VLVEKATEDGRGVEFRPIIIVGFMKERISIYQGALFLPAHEVDAAIGGYEGTCPHITNETVVFDLRV